MRWGWFRVPNVKTSISRTEVSEVAMTFRAYESFDIKNPEPTPPHSSNRKFVADGRAVGGTLMSCLAFFMAKLS
jgi:hypothetical protein